jgi:3,4-dihydroxy 2-butanone 4-phosphate synthase/GTP cyclohydrolase II
VIKLAAITLPADTRGVIACEIPTLVRVHQIDLTTDTLGWSLAHPDYVPRALRALASHDGPAAAVFVRDSSVSSISDRINGGRRVYQQTMANRDYGIGAQILRDLGIRDMILLTSSHGKLTALEGFGLRVLDRVAVPD